MWKWEWELDLGEKVKEEEEGGKEGCQSVDGRSVGRSVDGIKPYMIGAYHILLVHNLLNCCHTNIPIVYTGHVYT